MIRHYHIYECTGCIVTFAVEVAFENQSDIVCPACGSDIYIEDVGSGQMVEVHILIEDEESVEDGETQREESSNPSGSASIV